MKVIAVIPARYGSTRFRGKPLAKINGTPMLSHVIEGVRKSNRLDEIVVASDHEEILSLAQSMGVEAVKTKADLPTGTDRVREALKGREFDVAINVQGDEPLINGKCLDALAEVFSSSEVKMATMAKKMKPEDLENRNTAKIVLNSRKEAIYFSRFALPYSRKSVEEFENLDLSLKHIGIYAFRREALEKFCDFGETDIERAEGLEQLRALYLGIPIRVVMTDHESIGVDTPEDIQKIEKLLNERAER